MSYTISHTDENYGIITIEDTTINNETSLKFVGKNASNYGPTIAENFLHLLENFAKNVPPEYPIIGQLWYDTDVNSDPARPQLKIWDGTSWAAAGNIKKSVSAPLDTNSVIGDLWVNTVTQQLYLWSGTSWVLVGPQYSEGALAGPKVETIKDTTDTLQSILKLISNDYVVAIISSSTFVPKLAIPGFSTIKTGINLSTTAFTTASPINKLWGVAEKASALLVGSTTVDSSNFLRSDTINNLSQKLNIKNSSGLSIGLSLTTTLSNSGLGDTILSNSINGSSILLKVKKDGIDNTVLTATGNKVGINNINPVYELDVDGKIKTTSGIIVTSTDDITSTSSGSIVTSGGVTVAKSLSVGENLEVNNISSNNVFPKTTNSYDIGSDTLKWRNVYANTITANTFVGSFTGNISGASETASRLLTSTNFKIVGDVTSNTVSFNGQQQNNEVVLTTTLSSDIVGTKQEKLQVLDTDELLINTPNDTLYKTTKKDFLSNVATIPVGTILPFAGSVVPDGYLLCDGSEQIISDYTQLYNTIGHIYKPQNQLLGELTFGLPDLRGRFPLGMDSMNNSTTVPSKTDGSNISTIASSADRVSSYEADVVGMSKGKEDVQLAITNLPDHRHDLRGNFGSQFYAYRNVTGDLNDTDAIYGKGPTEQDSGQYLTNSGSVKSDSQIGLPVNVMNPYLTINYIIYTGKYNGL